MRLRHPLRRLFFQNLMKAVFELRHDKQDKAGTVPVYVLAYFDGVVVLVKEASTPRVAATNLPPIWSDRTQL